MRGASPAGRSTSGHDIAVLTYVCSTCFLGRFWGFFFPIVVQVWCFVFRLERATEAVAGGNSPFLSPIPSANSLHGLTNPGGSHPAVPEGPAGLPLGLPEGRGSRDPLGALQGGSVQLCGACRRLHGAIRPWGRAGQGCVTGRGAGKGLPGGQAAADGVSSVPRGLYHLSRSRGRWDCDFSRLPLGCRTPRCSALGMFWQLNRWGPSLSGVEKHFPCRGTARAAAGEARGESKFLEGPVLSEALLVPSDFFPPAFLPLCSQELERERFTC